MTWGALPVTVQQKQGNTYAPPLLCKFDICGEEVTASLQQGMMRGQKHLAFHGLFQRVGVITHQGLALIQARIALLQKLKYTLYIGFRMLKADKARAKFLVDAVYDPAKIVVTCAKRATKKGF